MRGKYSMVPIMKKIVPVLLVSVFLLPLTARSEIKAGSVEVSPFAGYNFFEKGQNLENRPVFGGRLGYNITNHFGIEATGEFIRSKVDDKSETFSREGQFTSPIDGVNITMYHLDLLYHFMPEGKFNPFIVAGYGAANYSPKINNKNMSVINFGAGAKYWVADNIALRFDLRNNMVYDEKINNLEATLGIVFAFGGKSNHEPAPVAKEVEPDSDGDGVPDTLDKCPGTPAGVAVDKNGCPPVVEKVVILESAPKVEEQVLDAAVEPDVIFLALEDVHFDFDQSTLKPEAKSILKRNIQLLKENPKAKIRIAGYTSASGSEAYNQKLSERRAKSVQEYLVNEGVITRDRLSTIGYGETRPAVRESAPKDIYSAAAKANIRVLFEVTVQ
jgi:OOP family OmpA-OmpF porin